MIVRADEVMFRIMVAKQTERGLMLDTTLIMVQYYMNTLQYKPTIVPTLNDLDLTTSL